MRTLDLLRSPLVAIDVGTATTRISWNSGELAARPSAVPEITNGQTVMRPVMHHGVVSDVAGVASVIRTLLSTRRSVWRRRPAAVVCAPTDVAARERDALVEAVTEGGASVAAVVPEPLAATIGAGIDVSSEYANVVVDIGDGVTDLAVFKNASIIFADARRIGCGTLRGAIHDWFELHEGADLPDVLVDTIMRTYCDSDSGYTGLAHAGRCVSVAHDDLDALLEPVIENLSSFIAETLRSLPAVLAAEVIESGVHITGGGAKLHRLVRRIGQRVGLTPICATEPLTAVIRGAGSMLLNEFPSGSYIGSTGERVRTSLPGLKS